MDGRANQIVHSKSIELQSILNFRIKLFMQTLKILKQARSDKETQEIDMQIYSAMRIAECRCNRWNDRNANVTWALLKPIFPLRSHGRNSKSSEIAFVKEWVSFEWEMIPECTTKLGGPETGLILSSKEESSWNPKTKCWRIAVVFNACLPFDLNCRVHEAIKWQKRQNRLNVARGTACHRLRST